MLLYIRPTGSAVSAIHSALNTSPVLNRAHRVDMSVVVFSTPSVTAGKLLLNTAVVGGLLFAYVSTSAQLMTLDLSIWAFRSTVSVNSLIVLEVTISAQFWATQCVAVVVLLITARDSEGNHPHAAVVSSSARSNPTCTAQRQFSNSYTTRTHH